MDLLEAPIQLSELAKKWDKREFDLILWIAEGKMDAFCWYESGIVHGSRKISLDESECGWFRVYGPDVEPLVAGKKSVKITRLASLYSKDFLKPIRRDEKSGMLLYDSEFTITIADLFILIPEVKRMEIEYADLKSETKKDPTEKMPEHLGVNEQFDLSKVLDTSHPWHSKQLAFAIKAWVALFGKSTDSPMGNKPVDGQVEKIKECLKKIIPNDLMIEKKGQNKPEITETAITKIAQLVNPDKRRGRGRSS